MLIIANTILPLFLIIFTSAIIKRYTKIGENWSIILNEFALYIGLPVLIFLSLSRTEFSLEVQLPIILINSAFIIFTYILSYLISKILKLSKTLSLTLFICLPLANVAYLGIPLVTRLYGSESLSTVSLIVALYLFFTFTIGIGYLDYSTKKQKANLLYGTFKSLFTNPLLLSVLFGAVFGLFSISVPLIVNDALAMVSASVTPIVLIVIGLFIGGSSKISKKNILPVFIFSLISLLILPAILYFALLALNMNPAEFGISIIESAMPLAITPFALADKYKLDKSFIAHSVVMSTILSIITLPFWISIIGN